MDTPKISKLIIRNFSCIGNEPVVIDIDKIVVLVGANNAGKSTVLRAFEVVTDCLKLELEDFHNRVVNKEALPQVEVHSIVVEDNKPGDEWCQPLGDNSWIVKEKWTWDGVAVEPKRIGFNVANNNWAQPKDKEQMPWGINNVAKSRRPKPHRVNTFDDPEIQGKAIVSLFKSLLDADIRSLKSSEQDKMSRYDLIIDDLAKLRADSKKIQEEGIVTIQDQANLILEKIFPNHALKVIATDEATPITIDFLGDEFNVEIGHVNGVSLPLNKQGSGTRRTALWTILKLLADKGVKAKPGAQKSKAAHEKLGPNSAHVLLLDEPEVSLHPGAVQNARDVLYSLPDNENWQIMITTHSPSFIDLSKDHTTIIRVEKNFHNAVEATTIFTPDAAKLSSDDKENLKLINLFDSHIGEAFFGGRVLIVEGDTEYSAINHIRQKESDAGNNSYKDVHVIRARGKVTVASMMKVLNHFKRKYFVLHDTDTPKTKSKVRDKAKCLNGNLVYKEIVIDNPAWTNNNKIVEQMGEYSRVVASLINFEAAYFDEIVGSDKPENCISHLRNDPDAYNLIKQLLDAIIEVPGAIFPEGALLWKDMDELNAKVVEREKLVQVQPIGA